MDKGQAIPLRSEVSAGDTWNLASLFADAAAWEAAFVIYKGRIAEIEGARNSLGSGLQGFASVLALRSDLGLLTERLGVYAHLRLTEDEGDNEARGRMSRFMTAATEAETAWAWFVPALLKLPPREVEALLADKLCEAYRVFVHKILRTRPHILSEPEERLLALQADANQTASDSFSVLTNVDIDFGQIETASGLRPLTQSTFASFQRDPDRSLRQRAWEAFYRGFDLHRHTLATLYAGSVKLDVYQARARGFASSRAAALFPDDVPETVYDNLVGTIRSNLDPLHGYYELRKRALGLPDLRHWDVYVPLAAEARAEHSYDEAVALVSEALAPLGPEYVATLRGGLRGNWVDRYENKGKSSGAFSSGSYSADPFILMNYKPDVLRDVFTLAHEGGHSMHSWYSSRSNPFLSYDYTIFEAEVASTFNEELLFAQLYAAAPDDATRVSLMSTKVDNIVATLFRQTMFAEFEAGVHRMQETGEPLTLDSLRQAYRSLLEAYFGPAMTFEAASDLEGLRIPHFYRAFYVYKYATGVSASIALSRRLLAGGAPEREDYFAFLRSGGSRYPIEALRVAGVDMASPTPIADACAGFRADVAELARLLGSSPAGSPA
ncbi:MAG: oligoendopeptidase F [Spirochaetota bacterium]